jgi:hypothetical protein
MNNIINKQLSAKISSLAKELNTASHQLASVELGYEGATVEKAMSEALVVASSINEFLELYVKWYRQ